MSQLKMPCSLRPGTRDQQVAIHAQSRRIRFPEREGRHESGSGRGQAFGVVQPVSIYTGGSRYRWRTEGPAHSSPYREAIVEAGPVRSGQVVLDVGCGTGAVLRLAAGEGGRAGRCRGHRGVARDGGGGARAHRRGRHNVTVCSHLPRMPRPRSPQMPLRCPAIVSPSRSPDPYDHGGLLSNRYRRLPRALRAPSQRGHHPASSDQGEDASPGSWPDPGSPSDGIFASTSAVEPAGRVVDSSVRSRRRSSDSPSPSGTVAFKCSLACTSGRSMTASTRLARLPGAICPDAARSDTWAVPWGPGEVVTSAAATFWSPSLISTCRGAPGSVMGYLLGIAFARASKRTKTDPNPGVAQTARHVRQPGCRSRRYCLARPVRHETAPAKSPRRLGTSTAPGPWQQVVTR
jgi:hypothetical protein